MTLHVRTTAVAGTPDLLSVFRSLPVDRRCAFLGGEVALVGAGSALEVPVGAGPDRGANARRALEAVLTSAEVHDEVRARGTGPIAVGSFTFDPLRSGSALRIPAVTVGLSGDVSWVTTAAVDAPPPAWAPSDPPTRASDGRRSRPRFAGSSLRDDAWLAAVAGAVASIGAGELEKVVLARDHHLWTDAPFDVPALLDALAARFPDCRTFLVDDLVGASPEPLLHVSGREVRSRVHAGPPPPGASARAGEARWAGRLVSDKDRREHAMAVASVVTPLVARGAAIDAPEVPSRLALDNVQHLATDVVGRLPVPVPALDLLDGLHPTAAVGGVPTDVALARIRATEGMDRGRYAGPVGWTDGHGDGEWALALRCAEVRGDRARLFAGAGIVAGSLPELELRETQLKLRAMLRVLEGLGAERSTTP